MQAPVASEHAALSVALPWPDRRLHPNGRIHWAPHAAAKKAARAYAHAITCATSTPAQRAALKAAGAVNVSMTFNPPDNRRRDDDGMIASMKAARDGIADAIGVDDSKWRTSYAILGPVKGGRVVVEVTA